MSVFEVMAVGPRLLRFRVAGRETGFGLARAGACVTVGDPKGSHYVIGLPPYPDACPWVVTPRLVDGHPPASTPALPAEVVAFGVSAGVTQGWDLLASLPSGEYTMVRSPVRPVVGAPILLGNDLLPSWDGATTLIDAPRFYAAVFSDRTETSALPAAPLFGVPVVDYTGAGPLDAVLFLSFTPAHSDSTPSQELILIIPEATHFLLDGRDLNLRLNPARRENRFRTSLLPAAIAAFSRN